MAERFIKGLNTDSPLQHQPEGTYAHAKNIVFNRMYGTVSNERGIEKEYDLIDPAVDKLIVGGTITEDGKLIVCSIGPTPSTERPSFVHIIYPDEYAELLLDDKSVVPFADFSLNFHPDKPVSGLTKKNYRNQDIIYLTDFYNTPKRLNLQNISARSMGDLTQNDIELFPNYKIPVLSKPVSVEVGGSVTSGSYTFFFQYEDETGNRSDFLGKSGSVPVVSNSKQIGYDQYQGNKEGASTDKLITFTVENVDTNYDYLRVGVISYIEGVKRAYIFNSYRITSRISGVLTGEEQTEEVPLEKLFQQTLDLKRIKTMTALNNSLLVGNIQFQENLEYQPYANNIKVDYHYEPMSKSEIKSTDYSNFQPLERHSFKNAGNVCFEKTLMAGEVYAIYVAPVLMNGKEEFSYHIPGRAPEQIDEEWNDNGFTEDQHMSDIQGNTGNNTFDNIFLEDLDISPNIRYFHTRDTYNNSNASSNLGLWINENETYPNNERFLVKDEDDNQVGDLRMKNVRHHKMPDYQSSNNNQALYNKHDSGIEEVKLIRLSISNIPIPKHLEGKIQGFNFYFAKRDNKNYTVSGQSLLMGNTFNYRPDFEESPDIRSHAAPYPVSLEDGNNSNALFPKDPNTYKENGEIEPKKVRTHAFDIIANDGNRPKVDFLKLQQRWASKTYDYTSDNDLGDRNNAGWGMRDMIQAQRFDSNDLPLKDHPVLIHHDLTKRVPTGFSPFNHFYPPDNIGELERIANVKDGSEAFLINNQVYSDIDNTHSERSYLLELTNKDIFNWLITYAQKAGHQENAARLRKNWHDNKIDSTNADWYHECEFNLVNLQRFQQDIYFKFENQELVPFSYPLIVSNKGTYSIDMKGGDTYLSDYSERNTAGIFQSYATPNDGHHQRPIGDNEEVVAVDTVYIKILYTYFCLTTLNANLRHATDDDYTNFYPELNNGSWSKTDYIDRPVYEGNDFRYNFDLTAINDNRQISHAPLRDTFNNHLPSVVAMAEKETWEKRYDPWVNFRANDYKDFGRIFGDIWKLKGYDDQLLIHFEHAFFRTLGRSRVQTDKESAYIGAGGVLQSEPKQEIADDHGAAGTRSQYASILTRYGYFFPDIDYGKVYLFSGQMKPVSNAGMNNFFEQNLRPQIIDQVINAYKSSNVTPNFDFYDKYDKPNSDQPVGLIAEFDEYYDRILLTKHDYDVSDLLPSTIILGSNDYTFEGQLLTVTNDFKNLDLTGGDVVLIDGVFYKLISTGNDSGGEFNLEVLTESNDPTGTFVKKSWTLSYYPKSELWASFHDYYPNWYFRRKNQLFSSKSKEAQFGNLFLHNTENTSYFYSQESGQKEDYIDLVINDETYQSIFLHSFFFLTKAFEKDGVENLNKTFTHAVVYNNYQCSGEIPLNNLRYVEGKWRFNNFHDLVENPDDVIINSDMSINTSNVNNNKPWFQKGDFRNNYHVVRIINKAGEQNGFLEIYLVAFDANYRISMR